MQQQEWSAFAALVDSDFDWALICDVELMNGGGHVVLPMLRNDY